MTESKLSIVNAVSWQAGEIAHLCTLFTNNFFLNNDDDDEDDDGEDGDDNEEEDSDDDEDDKNEVWRQQYVREKKLFFFRCFLHFRRRLPGQIISDVVINKKW